ncbi:MAG: efflux RND transporter periplasmic adaptor subunit [Verrucomicrobiales bacterium]|jgi:Cu(I)/Ag(I) efflux system membrane fusion protein|nr:efflux RND transporter periplasmic adaptor subunit [Verrucomicrobiales bacterium]
MRLLTRWTWLALLAGAGVWLAACGKTTKPPADSNIDYYTCPMHPEVRESKPGACPLCGMALTPVFKSAGAGPQANHHPPADPVAADHEHQAVAAAGAALHIAPERLQAIGARTGSVRREKLLRRLLAPGIVTIDEATLRDVNVKAADGYIEKLYANTTGQAVRQGEPLALILSEGWIEAQQAYLKAYRDWKRTRQFMASENPVLLAQEFERFRARLRVWDLSDAQLQQLEELALTLRDTSLTLRPGQGQGLSGLFALQSPIDGIVVEKPAVEGMKFAQGQQLFRLARLSPIWVEAEFPEDQAPHVALGEEFQVHFPALANQSRSARVAFIYPQFNTATRRLKARFVLANDDWQLRPGMYAKVSAATPLGERLTVPFEAVIPTGDRFVVFLDHGGGRLEPRFVELGEQLGETYEVRRGLNEGDRIIVSANFLIDSESRIQGVLRDWGDTVSGDRPGAASN